MINLGKSSGSQVAFDLDILCRTRMLIQSQSGGGKSWAIRRLLEQSHGKIQQIVLDLEGEFPTLAEKYAYIIAGKDGHTPAHPKSAKLLARKLLELNASCICDLYELKSHERIQFVRYFLESLVSAPKSLWHPVLVIVDEAHMFCPEKGQAESAGAVIDLVTRGRKRGLCGILATQRLSKLHKDACAELSNKLIGCTSLDIDQARAGDELGLRGKEATRNLRNLNPGQFYGYGPALCVSDKAERGVILMKIGGVKSHHPSLGTQKYIATPAPTGKIKQILAQLADLPEQAEREAKSMAELKRDNVQLRRELTITKKVGVVKPCGHEPVMAKREILIADLQGQLQSQNERLMTVKEAVSGVRQYSPIKIQAAVPVKINLPESKRVFNSVSPCSNGDATVPQLKILQSLSALEPLGLSSVNKKTLAAHVGVSPISGAYYNNLGRLRTLNLVTYPEGGSVALTTEGRSLAGVVDPVESLSEIHKSWLSLISTPQEKILSALIEIYPDSMLKVDLADQVEVSRISGAYFNNLGRLRTLGAVIYPSKGSVKASELLFPEEVV